ncbi:MAG: 4-hydroxybenzoate octaprenyltransferase [Parvularculaceae bacterium]|nr:4-hydroxybenzoate octaprenyltransferase [Parvularculaceae bacterium]
MTDVVTKTLDAEPGFVDRLPLSVQPYLRLMRVDRPVGVWLLWIPCLWGLILASPTDMDGYRFWTLAILFGIGSFVMRSAGCVYNDYIDRDLDRSVERTKDRPLASGAVQPKAALALVVALSFIGFAVLVQLGTLAIMVGLGSLAMVAAYPFAKRITWWPQVWLGLTFNWGILVGAAAASGEISVTTLMVYAAAVFWTLGYDTIYALQDIEDDALAGIKSSARRLGSNVRAGVAAFYGLTIALIGAAMLLEGAGTWTLLLAPAALHFAAQVVALEPSQAPRNLQLFKANIWPGLTIAMALFAI